MISSRAVTERLNSALLGELKRLMEDEFPLLLETYLKDSERQRERIETTSRTQELDELRRAAQSLKGASANLGAEALAALCAELEAQARAGSTEVIAATVERLDRELARVRRAVADERQACRRS